MYFVTKEITLNNIYEHLMQESTPTQDIWSYKYRPETKPTMSKESEFFLSKLLTLLGKRVCDDDRLTKEQLEKSMSTTTDVLLFMGVLKYAGERRFETYETFTGLVRSIRAFDRSSNDSLFERLCAIVLEGAARYHGLEQQEEAQSILNKLSEKFRLYKEAVRYKELATFYVIKMLTHERVSFLDAYKELLKGIDEDIEEKRTTSALKEVLRKEAHTSFEERSFKFLKENFPYPAEKGKRL